MEIRRTLILISLAVVSYFLFLTWQRDYAPGKETVAAAEIAQAGTASVSSAGLPVAPVTTAVPATGLPVAGGNVAKPVSEVPVAGNMVRVTTDVLDMQIDTTGGDIVRVALPAYTRTVEDKTPFVLLDRSQQHTYIAQSGLVRAPNVAADAAINGLDDNPKGRPVFQSAQSAYTLDPSQKALDVVLKTTTADGIEVTKTYHFVRGDYRVKVSYDIKNNASLPWSGVMFGQLKRDNAKDPSSDNHSFGMVTFLGAAYWTEEKNYNKIALSSFSKELVNKDVTGGWVAMVQHYFVSAWIPESKARNHISTRDDNNGAEHNIGFTGSTLTVAPGGSGQVSADFYAGPKIQDHLKALSPGLELTVDYGWLWPIAQFLFWLLKTIHGLLGNWGWSIVVLTILVKGAFFHLSAKSYRSMANMRRVMPEMQRMKEQFGSDRAKLSQAMMDLYKKEKINPLGGCLPILVQMPVFIALYWTLMESVELRHAGWILWIKDLSLMDPWFVLPLLMGVTMFVQQSLNPAPQDPMQARVMKLMPIMFTVFFLWFPAGLVLYWLCNNLLSIAQQWVITRQIENAASAKPSK